MKTWQPDRRRRIDDMSKVCFGIDIGGTTCKCGLFEAEGRLIEKWEIPTRTAEGGKNILPDVADAVARKIKERDIPRDSVVGIGVGVPGPVKNGVVPCAVNLHWDRTDIAGGLHALTGFPVRAGNDANVAALGEMWAGGAEGRKDVIVVTLGTGVGGGIIVDGKIVEGAHGAGGEVGHAHADKDLKERCNCGNYGCLEQFASATGIVRLAKEELAADKNEASVLRDHQRLNAKLVFDAYKEKDPVATRAVERFAECLGRSLSIFAAVLDPEVIVIGGGVSKAGDILVDVVGEYYRKYAFSTCRSTPVVLAKLENDAGIYGAAKLILDAEG